MAVGGWVARTGYIFVHEKCLLGPELSHRGKQHRNRDRTVKHQRNICETVVGQWNTSEMVTGLGPSSCANIRTQSWWIHINSFVSGLFRWLRVYVASFWLCVLWRGKWRALPGFSSPEWHGCIQNFPSFLSSPLKCGCMQGWTNSEKLVVACSVAGKWKRFYSWDDISVLVWKKQRSFESPWAPIKCLIFNIHHK